MHSPRRSARVAMNAAPCSSPNQPGRSPPWMSPSSVTAAQRAMRPRGQKLVLQKAGGGVVDRFLQVQQAQVVLAALADDDVGAALGGVGPDAGDLGLDLALQVAGESADPDRAFVLFSPDAGGREIAQGLAGAGAGLGQDEMRIALGLARQECGGGGAGVVGLAGPLLGVGAEDLGQPGARFGSVTGRRRVAAERRFPRTPAGGARLSARRSRRRHRAGPAPP